MLSKNMTKKKILLHHYVTQLPNDVLKCLPRFKRDEPYAILRGTLKPPLGLSWEYIMPLPFPTVERWKKELASKKGDNCKVSHRFFKDVLPLFAMIIVQDDHIAKGIPVLRLYILSRLISFAIKMRRRARKEKINIDENWNILSKNRLMNVSMFFSQQC